MIPLIAMAAFILMFAFTYCCLYHRDNINKNHTCADGYDGNDFIGNNLFFINLKFNDYETINFNSVDR